MPKKILILHGWNATPENHWFTKARDQWQKEGWQVEVPALPGNYFPQKEEWLKIIEKYEPDENWILLGHSLGGVAILRYLEKASKKIKQAILIATPYDAMKFGALQNFFDGGFDWEKIKANCPKFDLVYQDEDLAVPVEHGQKYAQALGGKIHILPGYNHFQSIDLEFLRGLIRES
jgi:predicted alpha/beta hydrolase family esterase